MQASEIGICVLTYGFIGAVGAYGGYLYKQNNPNEKKMGMLLMVIYGIALTIIGSQDYYEYLKFQDMGSRLKELGHPINGFDMQIAKIR